MYLSIKDPFLRLENHGYYLREAQYFNRFILKCKELIVEAAQGRLEDFITNTKLDPNEADLLREQSDKENRDKMLNTYRNI